jgi:tetratricopeptide (TPR) repeat protein
VKAREIVDKALRLKPNRVGALWRRGEVYLREGDLVKAAEMIDKALRLEPNNVEALWRRGAVYRRQGDIVKAAEMVDKALRLEPNNVEAVKLKILLVESAKVARVAAAPSSNSSSSIQLGAPVENREETEGAAANNRDARVGDKRTWREADGMGLLSEVVIIKQEFVANESVQRGISNEEKRKEQNDHENSKSKRRKKG